MVDSLPKVFRDQKFYILNRFFRLIFALLVTFLFFEDRFFQVFFVSEGFVQLLSVFFSFIVKRRFYLFFSIISLLIISYQSSYFFIFGFVIFESVYSLYQFNFNRGFNQKVELIFNSVIFLPLIINRNISFEVLSQFLFCFSLLRLIYVFKKTGHKTPIVAKKYYMTSFRYLSSINIRYFLVVFSVSPLNLICFRILNQFILLIWSYLKSKSQLPYADKIQARYFKLVPCLIFFAIVNTSIALSYTQLLFIPVNLIFIVYMLVTVYFLFYEIKLYRD